MKVGGQARLSHYADRSRHTNGLYVEDSIRQLRLNSIMIKLVNTCANGLEQIQQVRIAAEYDKWNIGVEK